MKRFIMLFKKLFNKKAHFRFAYFYNCKLFKVKSNQVLIESFHGQNISDSGLVLAKEIIKNYPNKYTIYFASENIKKHKKFINAIGLKVKLIDVNSFKYTKILATSKYIMANTAVPIYFIKRSEQVYLQTWHGTPLKTLGKKMRMGIDSMYLAQHGFLQADYLSQPNDFTRDVIMEDYNLERTYTGKVVMAGYPRNQIFMDTDAGSALKKRLGYESYTTYAYMPTWRGTSVRDVKKLEYINETKDILHQLDEKMDDKTILFVNFHPILRNEVSLGDYKHIKPFPADIESYEFLNSVDALITDYSSVFFDYSLTKKPVVLFMYDYEEYVRDRGMRLDVKKLPFRQIYTVEEMGKCLADGECLADSYENTEYFRTFFKYDSPDIAEKLIRLIFEGDKSDLEITDYSKNTEKPVNVYMPKEIKGDADFSVLSDVAGGDDDVVILPRRCFDSELNSILHDKYNDAFKYIITVKSVPKTYYEAIAGMFSRKIRGRILKRDLQRTIPNLRINGKPIVNINSGENTGVMLCSDARLSALKTKGSRCSFKVSIDSVNGGKVKGVILKSRSKVDAVEIPVDAKITHKNDSAKIKVKFSFTQAMHIKDVYWDVFAVVDYCGTRQLVSIKAGNPLISLRLALGNYDCNVGSNNLMFPYFAKGGRLSFCFRARCEYDTMLTRIKEITAFCIYNLLRPYFDKKKCWIIFGKFGKSAQDNSYYFFRYCMENLSDKEKKNIYYIIDKRSPDYENIKKYDSNVISFMSIKHMIYGLAMNVCISEDSKMHLYYWRSKPSIVNRRLRKKKEMFLQHGVTALKQVHTIFGKDSANPMTYFVATSKVEQSIVVNNFGYDIRNVPITGFCRWDNLTDKTDKNDRFILLMPTWRSWLEDVSNDIFLESDYYKNYISLLTDKRLDETLEKNNTRLVFCLHPKFAEYIDNFKDKSSKHITFIGMGEVPLNELMMKCSMLITDYSSVCWDVLYLNKPVLFYQFDYDMYKIAHGSYLDMETQLPGERSVDTDKLLDDIDKCASNDFRQSEKHEKMMENYFSYHDHNNCKRVYDFLKSMGH